MHRTVTGVVASPTFWMCTSTWRGQHHCPEPVRLPVHQGLHGLQHHSSCFPAAKSREERSSPTPVDNIVLYYVDPADSDFSKAGLVYTTAGEASEPHRLPHSGNYHTAVSESFAIMGMTLFAEYLDGISVQTITPGE